MATATQVESFCESCGTRYAFEPRRARGRHLVRVGRLVGILADDADIDSSAMVVSRDPFHGAFHFCLECRRFTCPSCWDTSAGFCRSCAMATGSPEAESFEDHAPDPEVEALLQSALASLMLLGTTEEWLRLEPPPAPRAEIWAAPPELVEAPEDELSPMIEAGLAVLTAKALADAERAEAEAEQRRLAEELRLEEERLVAEQAEQLRSGQEAEQARLAWEADQYRLAQEADYARQAAEAEQYRLAQEADYARQAAEAEHHHRALEAAAIHAIATPDQAEQLPPPEWAAMAASLGPDVEASVAPEPVTVEPVAAVEPQVAAEPEPVTVEVAAELEPELVTPEPEPVTLEPAAALEPAPVAADPAPVVAELPAAPEPPAMPEPQVVPAVAPPGPAPVPQAQEWSVPPPDLVPAPMPAATPSPEPAPAAWVPPPAPPLMPPPYVPPPQPPVAWQMTAPMGDPRGQWAPPPPPPGWTPNRLPMAALNLPQGSRGSRSGFAAGPTVGPVKGGVRPCPRCDLPLSGQARFCRRCGLPQV